MSRRHVAILSLIAACVLGSGTLLVKRAREQRSVPTASTSKPDKRPFRAPRPGTIVVESANAATPERVMRAVRDSLQTSPELLSTTAALPPFNAEDFARNPKDYLAQVVPARCMQTAPPGEGVPPLQVQSQSRAALDTDQVAPLWVKGVPGAPVTFTAFDGGSFKENGLTSVTVQANANGLAVAHYTAGRGIGGDVTILAGSPLSSGTQRFFLRVGGNQALAVEGRTP